MHSPPTTIRPANPHDYEALCALWTELDEHHRAGRLNLFRIPEGPRREREWALDLVRGPDSTILVAEATGGALAGLAALRVETPTPLPIRITQPFVEVHNLVVTAAFRRTGLAKRLILEAVRWAAARGLGELELTVHEFNTDARAFYDAAGFSTIRRRMRLPVELGPC